MTRPQKARLASRCFLDRQKPTSLRVKPASPCPRNPFLFFYSIEESEDQTNIPVLESVGNGERDAMRLSIETPIVNQLIADASFLRLGPRSIDFQLRAVPP